MRSRLLACAAFAAAVPAVVSAVPITSYRLDLADSSGNLVAGTMTAHLALYRLDFNNQGGTPFLVHEFDAGIGNDFTVAVPAGNGGAAWEAVIPAGSSPAGDWVLAKPGLSGVAVLPNSTVVTPDTLDTWCTASGGAFVNGIFVMAARGGTCSFGDKATNIASRFGAGALIVNTIPGGAQQISLGTTQPGIPVVFLSREAGERFLDRPVVGPFLQFIDYVQFSARWDPDPVSVPEPATLALFALGAACLGVARARRRGT